MLEESRFSEQFDFSKLVLGFASAALYHIGEKGALGHACDEPNLMLARQNLDILKILSDKTQSNLTSEEESLLKSVLADLEARLGKCSKGASEPDR